MNLLIAPSLYSMGQQKVHYVKRPLASTLRSRWPHGKPSASVVTPKKNSLWRQKKRRPAQAKQTKNTPKLRKTLYVNKQKKNRQALASLVLKTAKQKNKTKKKGLSFQWPSPKGLWERSFNWCPLYLSWGAAFPKKNTSAQNNHRQFHTMTSKNMIQSLLSN